MTVAEFITKWRHVALTERSSSQTHFLDLCRLVDHPDPVADDPQGDRFTFERGVTKATGGDGWADVWKKGCFGWEYKGLHRDLDAAYGQLLLYQGALENPPLLVTCDTDRILVHTHFPNTPTQTIELTLEGLADAEQFSVLHAVFHDPSRLRPSKTVQTITEEAAGRITDVAQALRGRGIAATRVARFLDRLVFCLFAEDVGLLPDHIFARVLENTRRDPVRFQTLLGSLFAAMETGGDFGADRIAHFDGDVFKDAEVLELTADELALVAGVTAMDWAAIDPSIFGTLFERALDPDKRSQLGAHYTSREDIETIVNPVIIDPLRREWATAREQVETLLSGKPTQRQHRKAGQVLREFLGRLQAVTVLDPACGSGNFLYVTLQKLKDLEKDVIVFAASHHFGFFPGVGPWQLHGIELNKYAFELAQMTAWIGYLQWVKRNGFGQPEEPILRPLTSFECKDAVLDLQPDSIVQEPEWPAAEFIVSNPPFLGRAKLREYLGDDYVEGLYTLWSGRVPAEADYCCYWFEKARAQIVAGKAKRAGLLATQAIRSGANREVLSRILDGGAIFFAQSDRPWVLDGAAVRVSMVGFDDGSESNRVLDGQPAGRVNADLTTGLDLTRAVVLPSNTDRCFQGPVKVGDFDVPFEQAASMLSEPNPHGRPNSDVIRPWLNGKGITDRNPHKFIIDFAEKSQPEAALYSSPFGHVEQHIRPTRVANRDRQRRERWWLLGRSGSDLRRASSTLQRVVFTPRVAKYRLFIWAASAVLPDARLYAFAAQQDWFFGVLHSRVHEAWSLAKAARHGVGNDPTYSTESCFETFAFPDASEAQRNVIATAACELDTVRGRWLNPPEWTREETLVFPASVDGPWHHVVESPDSEGVGTARYVRLVPVDDAAGQALKKRNLTALYNEAPTWLRDLHAALDTAVLTAYGLPTDATNQQVLAHLLELNLTRSRDGRSA